MNAEDAERRIRELEDEVRRLRTEASMYKETVHDLLRDTIPDDPPTKAEIHKLLTQRDGKPIAEILAELERELT